MIHANSPQKKSDSLFIDDLIKITPEHGLNKNTESLFKTKVSADFFACIDNNNLKDPIALQVLPSDEELIPCDGFVDDPVGDVDAMQTPGLIHKYKNRALLICTANCAIHCRYCFRRNFDYKNSVSKKQHLQSAVDYLKQHSEINEVILSGGDPLTLSNASLFTICDALIPIKHIKTLRFHSRFPVVQYNRFDSEFLNYFKLYPKNKVFVSHINHANELTQKSHTIFNKLKHVNFSLLNQSVLLRGINDNVECLTTLSYRLFEQGVLPYYLHLLDQVKGASHFMTTQSSNQKIHQELQQQLPGYLVPKMVKEIAGKANKTPFYKTCE